VDTQGPSGVSFSGLVLSLATTAALHFGDIPDPSTGRPAEPDVEGAGHIIELLGILQEKTKGNLDGEEAQLLDDVLYDLRLRFVEARDSGKRIITP
jgi:hypothetical protein